MSLRKKTQVVSTKATEFPPHVAGFIPRNVPEFVDEGNYIDNIMIALEEGHGIVKS